MHYLYLITRDDGEQYVGVTKRLPERIQEHFSGRGSKYLKAQKFTWDVLLQGDDATIYAAEQEYISKHNPSLNVAPGGADINAPKGESHHSAVFTDELIVAIRHRVHNGETRTAIAKQYGVSANTISRICTGTRWSHVGGPLTVDKPRMPAATKAEIVRLKGLGHTYRYIAEALTLDYNKVCRYGRTI